MNSNFSDRNNDSFDPSTQEGTAMNVNPQNAHQENAHQASANHDTVNHDTVNHDTVNHDTVNHDTVNHDSANHEPAAMDNLKRDRFELLSAYLDGEVTASERQQVETWLKTDAKAQQLYARLLNLRQAFRNLPTPAPEQPVEKTVQQVVSKLERKSKRKYIWGGMAIAALFVSALVGGLPRPQYATNFAEKPQIAVPDKALMIALDRPLIDNIPVGKAVAPSQIYHSPSRNIE